MTQHDPKTHILTERQSHAERLAPKRKIYEFKIAHNTGSIVMWNLSRIGLIMQPQWLSQRDVLLSVSYLDVNVMLKGKPFGEPLPTYLFL